MIEITDLLPDVCMCGHEATHQCLHKLYWCGECGYRGQFLDWGTKHGYPALEAHSVAVPDGEEYWMVYAAAGNEDAIYTLLAYIEWLDDTAAKESAA